VSFSTYVTQRMSGFGGESKRPTPRDIDGFPIFRNSRKEKFAKYAFWNPPQAVDEVRYKDLLDAKAEADRFRVALHKSSRSTNDAFMTAVAPGVIACTMTNAYYSSHSKYVLAIAKEMRKEYELLASYGYMLQNRQSPTLRLKALVNSRRAVKLSS
jgi:5-methyltetrahydropteroyltriglutamate--homocysteine methyltransferase